jgi:hypothetical protein
MARAIPQARESTSEVNGEPKRVEEKGNLCRAHNRKPKQRKGVMKGDPLRGMSGE